MSTKSDLENALNSCEDALRYVKREINNSNNESDELRKAKRELDDAIDFIQSAINSIS